MVMELWCFKIIPLIPFTEIYSGKIGNSFFNEIKHYPLRYAVIDSIQKQVSFRREFELSSDSMVQIDGDLYSDKICKNGLLLSIYSISQFKKIEKHNRQFVANVSHELKTPLTAILGYIETLIDSEEIDESMRMKFLQVVKKIVND